MNSEYGFPLNTIKEKILMSIPNNTDIDNSSVVALELSLREFLITFINESLLNDSNLNNQKQEKKVMVKDIKETIEKNKKYSFLMGLLEGNNNKQ